MNIDEALTNCAKILTEIEFTDCALCSIMLDAIPTGVRVSFITVNAYKYL